jgi:regulator of replication initiation timing
MRNRLKQESRDLYGSESPLHFSIKTNNINRVKQLLRTTDPNKYHWGTGETPLHLACRLGNFSMVKLLVRHPGIKTDLLTKGGPKSVKPAGCTPISLVKDNPSIVSFLQSFKPKDNLPVQENTIIESELQTLLQNIETANRGYKSELKVLRPEFKELDQENQRLKKELAKMKKQDVKLMGTELPREKPNDTRKLAEVLANVRKLQQELTACQERFWDEKENDAKCSICVDRPKDTVLFPCGHLFCFSCSEGLIECAKCQKPIEQRLQTSK